MRPEGPNDESRRADRRRALRFFAIASAALAVLLGGFAAAARLEIFGAGFHVNFALVLGVAGTILLGVGLMALSFYSARSGADEAVLGMDDDWRDPPPPGSSGVR